MQTKQNELSDEVVEFIERAGMREYAGGMRRSLADSAALQDVAKIHGTQGAKQADAWRRANP